MAERYGVVLMPMLPVAHVNALSLTFHLSYISLH